MQNLHCYYKLQIGLDITLSSKLEYFKIMVVMNILLKHYFLLVMIIYIQKPNHYNIVFSLLLKKIDNPWTCFVPIETTVHDDVNASI